MAGRPRTDGAGPRPRRSRTVWPWVFGLLLLTTALLLLAFGLGWLDTTGDVPGT